MTRWGREHGVCTGTEEAGVVGMRGRAALARSRRGARGELPFVGGTATADAWFLRVGVVGGVGSSKAEVNVGERRDGATGEAAERPGDAGGGEETVGWGDSILGLRGADGARRSSRTVWVDDRGALCVGTCSDGLGLALLLLLVATSGRLRAVVIGIVAVVESQWASIVLCHLCTISFTWQ